MQTTLFSSFLLMMCQGLWTLPPPLRIESTQKYGINTPYTYCSLDKGVACAQHMQLPTHT